MCMCGCGKWIGLDIDHVIPRSNFRIDPWDPCNGQLIHHALNMEKGSSHGKKWDFRPKKFKAFQRLMRAKEWRKDHMGRWEYIHPEKKNPPAKEGHSIKT